jgi:hypothetical protein
MSLEFFQKYEPYLTSEQIPAICKASLERLKTNPSLATIQVRQLFDYIHKQHPKAFTKDIANLRFKHLDQVPKVTTTTENNSLNAYEQNRSLAY